MSSFVYSPKIRHVEQRRDLHARCRVALRRTGLNTSSNFRKRDASPCNILCKTHCNTYRMQNTLQHVLQRALQHTATHTATGTVTHCNTYCNGHYTTIRHSATKVRSPHTLSRGAVGAVLRLLMCLQCVCSVFAVCLQCVCSVFAVCCSVVQCVVLQCANEILGIVAQDTSLGGDGEISTCVAVSCNGCSVCCDVLQCAVV